jgi:hypothetical protein
VGCKTPLLPTNTSCMEKQPSSLPKPLSFGSRTISGRAANLPLKKLQRIHYHVDPRPRKEKSKKEKKKNKPTKKKQLNRHFEARPQCERPSFFLLALLPRGHTLGVAKPRHHPSLRSWVEINDLSHSPQPSLQDGNGMRNDISLGYKSLPLRMSRGFWLDPWSSMVPPPCRDPQR